MILSWETDINNKEDKKRTIVQYLKLKSIKQIKTIIIYPLITNISKIAENKCMHAENVYKMYTNSIKYEK